MFKHVVCQKFHYKEDAKEAARMLRILPERIPELISMQVGLNEIESERAFDLVLIAQFENVEGLHAYEKHPAHMEVRNFIKARRSGSVSVDFSLSE